MLANGEPATVLYYVLQCVYVISLLSDHLLFQIKANAPIIIVTTWNKDFLPVTLNLDSFLQ